MEDAITPYGRGARTVAVGSPDLAIIVCRGQYCCTVTKIVVLVLLMLRDRWQARLLRARERGCMALLSSLAMVHARCVCGHSDVGYGEFPPAFPKCWPAGAASFGMVVVLTMLAAHCFDPRSAWITGLSRRRRRARRVFLNSRHMASCGQSIRATPRRKQSMTTPERRPRRSRNLHHGRLSEVEPLQISWIWLVPLGSDRRCSLLFRDWLHAGPTVVISFDSAEGLEVGQTRVRYKKWPLARSLASRWSPDRKKGAGERTD